MNLTVHRDGASTALDRKVYFVRNEEGRFRCFVGLDPVAMSDTGEWGWLGTADEETAEQPIPPWLLELLGKVAPDDWRKCKGLLTGLTLQFPLTQSKDDSQILSALLEANETLKSSAEERRIRAESAESELRLLKRRLREASPDSDD